MPFFNVFKLGEVCKHFKYEIYIVNEISYVTDELFIEEEDKNKVYLELHLMDKRSWLPVQ